MHNQTLVWMCNATEYKERGVRLEFELSDQIPLHVI